MSDSACCILVIHILNDSGMFRQWEYTQKIVGFCSGRIPGVPGTEAWAGVRYLQKVIESVIICNEIYKIYPILSGMIAPTSTPSTDLLDFTALFKKACTWRLWNLFNPPPCARTISPPKLSILSRRKLR